MENCPPKLSLVSEETGEERSGDGRVEWGEGNAFSTFVAVQCTKVFFRLDALVENLLDQSSTLYYP